MAAQLYLPARARRRRPDPRRPDRGAGRQRRALRHVDGAQGPATPADPRRSCASPRAAPARLADARAARAVGRAAQPPAARRRHAGPPGATRASAPPRPLRPPPPSRASRRRRRRRRRVVALRRLGALARPRLVELDAPLAVLGLLQREPRAERPARAALEAGDRPARCGPWRSARSRPPAAASCRPCSSRSRSRSPGPRATSTRSPCGSRRCRGRRPGTARGWPAGCGPP